jgi:hypothetical protein
MRTAPSFTFWDGAGTASKMSYYNGSWVDGQSAASLAISTKSAVMTFSGSISIVPMAHFSAYADLW